MSAAKPRRGRPPLDPADVADVKINVRLTQAQREKVDALGGAPWIRAAIDAAPLPKPTRRKAPPA